MTTLAEYERWKANRQQQSVGAAQVVLGSIEETPDQVAGDLNLASEFGKVTGNPVPPLPMVREYRNIFQQKIEEQRNKTTLSKSPVLAEWLRNPDNAALTRDDLDGLSWWEELGAQAREAVRGIPGGAISSVGTAAEGTGQLLTPVDPSVRRPLQEAIASASKKTPEEIAALRSEIFKQGVINPTIAQSVLSDVLAGDMTPDEALTALEPAIAPALQAASQYLQSGGEAIQQYGSETLPAAPGMEESFGRDVGSGIGSLLTILGVGLVTGGTGAMAFGGAMGAGEASARARKAGQDEDTQTIAALYGVFPGMTEAIPIERLIANPVVKSGLASILRSVGVQTLLEGGQEAVQEVLQNAIARNLYAPDQDVLAGVMRSFQTGGFIGGLVEAGRIAANAALPGRFRHMQDSAARAPETVEKLQAIAQAAVTSKTRERTPDVFRDFVAQATANGPVENVYVPADQFVQYFQGIGVDPFALVDELEGVTRDDLDVALISGELQIPMATFAAKIAGSGHEQFFIENARFDPDEMSAVEAAEFNEKAQDVLQEAWEIAESVRVERELLSAVEDQIYDSMVSRLRTAGRSTDVATTEAMLYPAFYRAMSSRPGAPSIEELLRRYPLPEIRGDLPQGIQFRNVDELNRTLAMARSRRAVGADTRQSLLEFISDYGGINDVGGELKSRDAEVIRRGKGKKTLRLARGGVVAGARDLLGAVSGSGRKHGADDVAQAVIEAGFLADDPIAMEYRAAQIEGREVPDITRALWNAIDSELRGVPQYAADHEAEARAEEERQLDDIEAYLSSLGVSLQDDDATIRQAIEGARQYAQPAFHGTPHLFDKFSTDHIGTGEGAQAYGWGLYFAEKKEIAEHYRSALATRIVVDGKTILSDNRRRGTTGNSEVDDLLIANDGNIDAALNEESGHLAGLVERGAPERSVSRVRETVAVLQDLKDRGAVETKTAGRVYEVEIPNDDELLAWDLPLKDQPAGVREKLQEVIDIYKDFAPGSNALDGDNMRFAQFYHMASSAPYGTPQQLSRDLAAVGIPGHRFLDGGSRDNGDGTYNYVIYDDSRVAVRSFEQSGDVRGARGLIQFPAGGVGNGDTVIRLFESANLSTMLHESGHYFLTVMQDMAARGETNAVSDYDAVKSWWRDNAAAVAKDAMRVMPDVTVTADDVIAALDNGTTGDVLRDGAIDVGMQEQWARGFEAYLMEGKAPSADLRSAFEKFRSWLISVYKKLAGLNVTISDDIRGVFDRMLASDEEIAKAQADVGGDHPLFANAEEMGLTPEDYAAFMKLRAQAEDEAKARLMREAMAPVKREKEKWFKDEKAKVREEVEREVNAYRYFRAIEWMGNRRWFGDGQPEDMPDIRLSKDILVERYGKGVLDTLPRGKQTVYAVEGGIDPDDAAGWFGFDSGDEMIRAMERAPKRTEAIDAETDRVMRERHGDVLNDGSIEAAALDAVHTDKRGQWIAAELKAVVDIAGTGVGMTAKEARASAKQTIARMRVRDALSAGRFLAAERKAAEEAARLGAMLAREGIWMGNARRRIASKARAAVRGDGTVEAVAPQIDQANRSTGNYNETVARLIEVKRRQLVNHSLYMEARKVADEVEKAENLVARLEKSTRKIRSERKRLGEASIAGDYVEAIEAIIYGYEFRKVSNRQIERRAALQAYVARMTEEGRANELAIPQAVLDDAKVINYRMLTVEHLRGVVDSLKNIEHVARLKGKLLINNRKRDYEEAVGDVAGAITANVKGKTLSWVPDEGLAGRAGDFVTGYIASVQTATTILRQLDGRKDMGIVYETLKADMDNAAYSERKMRKEATDEILKLYSVYTPDEQRQMAVRKVVPSLGGQSFSKWNLIAMALNMGNEGNLARLTNKNARMHLEPAQVEAVKAMLDKRDWDFVQSVWDYINSYRPKIAERDRRIRGIEPSWVEAAPVETPHGTYRGGYYPIKYEGSLGGARFSAGDSDADILNSMMSGGYASAQTKDGHLKARGEHIKQSLTLDIGVIAQHANEVIHDLAFSEPVVNTWRILTSGAVEGAMIDAGLQKQHKALKLWVQDAASGQVGAGSDLARAVQFIRSGFTYSKLALNLKTILLQPLGLMQSGVVVGKRNLATQVARYVRDPLAMTNDVLARSKMMGERRETFNKDLMDAVAKSNVASPTASKFRKVMDDYAIPFGMAGITYAQFYLVDVPTWAAAFQSGLKQFGGDEVKAAQHADMTVQRSQGSGIWSDRSGIERGTLSQTMRQNPFVMLMTTLGSYFFAKTNLIIERTQGLAAQPITPGAAMSYALDLMILLAGEAAVIALVGEIGDAIDGDDDDEDKSLIGTIGLEAAKTFLAGLPGVRDAVGLSQGFQAGTYAAILDTFWQPIKQASQGEVDKALVKSTVNLTGMMMRLPSSQANRIIDGAWRDLEGEDVSPLEYLLGRMGK